MADPILLLTPLRKTGHNFKAAIASGSWVPISGTLGELGKALDVDEAAQVDVVRSICAEAFHDRGDRGRIGQDLSGFFEILILVYRHQDRRRTAVAGHDDVLTLINDRVEMSG